MPAPELILPPKSLDKSLGWEAYNCATLLEGCSQSARQPATPEDKGGVHATGTRSNALSFKLTPAPSGTIVETLKVWVYVGAIPDTFRWRWWWGTEELEHASEYEPVTVVGWASLTIPSPTFAATQTLNVVFQEFDEGHGAKVRDTYGVVNEAVTVPHANGGPMLPWPPVHQ